MNTSKRIKKSLILVAKNRLTISIIIGLIIGVSALGASLPSAVTSADFTNTTSDSSVVKITDKVEKVVKTIKVTVTAYSSTPDQTDDTPFITASGKYVRDGIIASNLLPFGTKIKIPKLYGDKIFVVEDRMNKKKGNYHMDIWMPTRNLAINFGSKTAEIQILVD